MFLIGVWVAVPDAQDFFTRNILLDFGIFIVLGYATGHFVAAVGNWLEHLFNWIRGGFPTDILRLKDQTVYPKEWREKILKDFGIKDQEDIELKLWRKHVSRISATINHANPEAFSRIKFFNGNYGMFRGLIAASLLVALLELIEAWMTKNWVSPVLLIICGAVFVLSYYRMERFSRHYAKELFAQYMSLKKEEK